MMSRKRHGFWPPFSVSNANSAARNSRPAWPSSVSALRYENGVILEVCGAGLRHTSPTRERGVKTSFARTSGLCDARFSAVPAAATRAAACHPAGARPDRAGLVPVRPREARDQLPAPLPAFAPTHELAEMGETVENIGAGAANNVPRARSCRRRWFGNRSARSGSNPVPARQPTAANGSFS